MSRIEVMEPHHNLVVGVVSSRIAKGMEEGAESIAATAATAATAAAAAAAAEAALLLKPRNKQNRL